jgi:hypothetical protein
MRWKILFASAGVLMLSQTNLFAQQQTVTLAQLLSQGYEIKGMSSENSLTFYWTLQKTKDAYLCWKAPSGSKCESLW